MGRQTQPSQQFADLAVILVRKSDDDIPGAPTWEEQQARCRAYCKARNYGIVSLVIQNGPPPFDFGVSQRRFPKEYPGSCWRHARRFRRACARAGA